MKKYFISTVLLTIISLPISSSEYSNGIINKDNVQVRIKKDFRSKVIDTLKNGEAVQIIKKRYLVLGQCLYL